MAEDMISTLARKFKVEVMPGAEDPATDSWLPLRGVQELTTSKEDNLEDDSDYDSDGWTSQVRTGQSWSVEAKVARKQSGGADALAYDPGQELVRAASDQFGIDGTVRVRWFNRNGGDEAYMGLAQAGFTDDGGASTALSTATITLTGTGKRERITNPSEEVPAG
ncbi:MAG: hypothetical protein L0G94_10110 [Brachybacterium sp.]|uniref:phage tail tube protein n=1 Tax=Brachybacterium sp. TaxID=1891286 RepID=UPI002648650C|nr:hypothetical protein [Brachybacterium sp.]MDN5687007.1 hypothetical protein [Brachybacterium sp.]